MILTAKTKPAAAFLGKALMARRVELRRRPAERTERRLRTVELERTEGILAAVVKHPPRPRGWALAREAIAARWRQEAEDERRARERQDGTLARRERHDQAVQAIHEKREGDLA